MAKKLQLACALALCSFSLVAGADPQPLTQMTPFHALASVPATPTVVATCQGVDGTYTLLSVVGSGPVTSTDPRMSGTFNVNALILDSPTTSLGVSRDDWTITDPTSGAIKAKGAAIATDLAGQPRSITFAMLADGSQMVANALVTLPPPGTNAPILIEYGGAGLAAPDRAVIVEGHNECVRKMFSALYSLEQR